MLLYEVIHEENGYTLGYNPNSIEHEPPNTIKIFYSIRRTNEGIPSSRMFPVRFTKSGDEILILEDSFGPLRDGIGSEEISEKFEEVLLDHLSGVTSFHND